MPAVASAALMEYSGLALKVGTIVGARRDVELRLDDLEGLAEQLAGDVEVLPVCLLKACLLYPAPHCLKPGGQFLCVDSDRCTGVFTFKSSFCVTQFLFTCSSRETQLFTFLLMRLATPSLTLFFKRLFCSSNRQNALTRACTHARTRVKCLCTCMLIFLCAVETAPVHKSHDDHYHSGKRREDRPRQPEARPRHAVRDARSKAPAVLEIGKEWWRWRRRGWGTWCVEEGQPGADGYQQPAGAAESLCGRC